MARVAYQNTFLLALVVGAALRILFIAQIPGLHFDEAWAANYAAKIATTSGFWPVDAMSPYTHPWSHYVTALFFKLLGVHLWVARLAGVTMSGAGIVLLGRSLHFIGEKRATAYFACLSAVCIPSILNERFAIEINTFLVFCLGLFVYGLVTRRGFWIVFSAFLGVTSHILFVAPVLSAFWVWATSDRAKPPAERLWVGCEALLLLPFFFSVYLGIPEKGKALALIAIDLGVLFYTLRPFSLIAMERKLRCVLLPVVFVFFLILAAMMEGDLSVAFTHGFISSIGVCILSLTIIGLGTLYLLLQAYKQIRQKRWPKYFASWLFYLVFLVGIISTKPAPRYFETVFLVSLAAVAITLSRLSSEKTARTLISAFVLVSVVQWRENYILPGLRHQGLDRSYQYLIFHDTSSDSLPKQELVNELASEGCSFQQIQTSDPRLAEALEFLSKGDWPLDPIKKCPGGHFHVERAASGILGKRLGEFVLFH